MKKDIYSKQQWQSTLCGAKDCQITADVIVTAVRNQDGEGAADWSRSGRFGYALFSFSLVITCAYVTV